MTDRASIPPPNQIASVMAREWALPPSRLTRLQLGHAAGASTWRAEVDGVSYFLKLTAAVNPVAVQVQEFLQSNGSPVVAPLRTRMGARWHDIGHHSLLVYPWIEGAPVDLARLSSEDAYRVGAALRSIHKASLPGELQSLHEQESFVPWGEHFYPRIAPALANCDADPLQHQLAALWAAHGFSLEAYLRRVQVLGQAALATNPAFCLCHNDFQSHNLLKTASGNIVIVDWDHPVWAPPELDLLHLPREHNRSFENGYGPFQSNPRVHDYLHANWLLQEFFDCVQRILFSAVEDTAEQGWALDLLRSMLPRMEAILSA